MGTFLDHSLKSSEGPEEWLEFFALASSSFAILEGTPRIPGQDQLSDMDTFEKLLVTEETLDVLNTLSGFRVVAKKITEEFYNSKKGKYHLVTLNLDERMANIQTYEAKYIQQANEDYSKKEEEARAGKNIQVVLVTSESIAALKKAYPSFFLDSENFANQIKAVKKQLAKIKAPRKRI